MVTRRSSRTRERTGATIRSMRTDDLEMVVQLDARVFGIARPAFFERRIALLGAHDSASHTLGLVAEENGAVVGFVLGTLTSGEFGFAGVTVLMDSIAVAPHRQRHGIGHQLTRALVAESAALGARDMYTLVDWKAWDMLAFFDAADFGLAQMVLLHQHIGEPEEVRS
jgi:predicted N-acetyltransferase YhbS